MTGAAEAARFTRRQWRRRLWRCDRSRSCLRLVAVVGVAAVRGVLLQLARGARRQGVR